MCSYRDGSLAVEGADGKGWRGGTDEFVRDGALTAKCVVYGESSGQCRHGVVLLFGAGWVLE